MDKSRGYISHSMNGGRSVPQRVQQMVIRDYCERNWLEFLLSATEFEGQTIMLDSIKEDVVVMYSMFLVPQDRSKLARFKRVCFAAENCEYTPEMEDTFNLMGLVKQSAINEVNKYV